MFVGASIGGVAVFYPMRKRLDQGEPQDGIGARRLIGQEGVVMHVGGSMTIALWVAASMRAMCDPASDA